MSSAAVSSEQCWCFTAGWWSRLLHCGNVCLLKHYVLRSQLRRYMQWLPGAAPACADRTGCADLRCPAALCRVCREEADTPRQVLLRCPSFRGTRLRIIGSILAQAPDMTQDDDVVASLASGFRGLRNRLGTPRPYAGSGGTTREGLCLAQSQRRT